MDRAERAPAGDCASRSPAARAPARRSRSTSSCRAGRRVLDAIRASGVLERHPELDLARQAIGIWGRACALDAPLHDGDRVEIYRPLQMDPKEARRLRRAPARGAAPLSARYFGSRPRSRPGCAWSRRRAACRRGTRARRSSRWCARGGCRSRASRSCAWARLQLSALAAAICLPRPCPWRRPRPRPSCAWPRAPDRPPCGATASMRPQRAAERASAADAAAVGAGGAARGAARSAAARMSCSGVSGRRRQVAVLDAAALVAPLPLRFGRQGEQRAPRAAASTVRRRIGPWFGRGA